MVAELTMTHFLFTPFLPFNPFSPFHLFAIVGMVIIFPRKPMRLVQVAKALGMTGQQLRKELSEVEFGIKPTDREIPDNLAQGVIRYVARKNGIEVDMEALGLGVTEEGETDPGPGPSPDEKEDAEPGPEPGPDKPTSAKPKSLNVLRKLTLEDVPKDAIVKEAKKLQMDEGPSKEEKAEIEREEQALKRVKEKAETRHLEQIKKKDGTVLIPAELTVKEFAEKAGIQVPTVVQSLMSAGVMATVNQTIDYETAAIVAAELGVTVQKEETSAEAEHLFSRNLEELLKDEPENMEPRPPIVVVMGHVDHGKTAILDAIRQTDVVAGEAGGITQHIGAYQVDYVPKGTDESHKITFLDTPGHEAFTAMRARGAQITDIAIIVVSAEEGIKPTTIEAIDHAQDAQVPIIVAVNKIDKENADPERVKGELAGHGLQAEDWGGQTSTVLCSAVTKQGIDDLLDHIVLTSQLKEIKANRNRSAIATVVESHLDSSLGALATVVVNAGSLQTSDVFICGETTGRVRAMMDAHGVRMESVAPSGAVRVSGFSDVPQVGDILQVVSSEKEARELLMKMQEHTELHRKRSFADLVTRLSEGKLNQLKVVLKADTQGSIEALQESLRKLTTDQVAVKVIHSGLGSVSESDVMMAAASDGIVVAFHTGVGADVRRTAEREGVEIREYDVVYSLLEDIDGLLKGLVEPEEEEKIIGHLKVKEVFLTKKKEMIVGGRVTDGSIKRLPFRLMRGEEEVGSGRITSLRHGDKDIKEAKEGTDCGMRTESSIPIEVDDVMEIYLRELKKRKQ